VQQQAARGRHSRRDIMSKTDFVDLCVFTEENQAEL